MSNFDDVVAGRRSCVQRLFGEENPELPAVDVVFDAILFAKTRAAEGDDRWVLLDELESVLAKVVALTEWTGLTVLAVVGCPKEIDHESAVHESSAKLELLKHLLQVLQEVVEELTDLHGDPQVAADLILSSEPVLLAIQHGDAGRAFVEAMSDKRSLDLPIKTVRQAS